MDEEETVKARREETSAAAVSAAVPVRRASSLLAAAAGGKAGNESFGNAFRELKDLRSQLHQAADCCERAYLNTEKKLILESTKSYICDALVAVIDHLGTVSSKLEHQLLESTEITQTEHKINFLKQRLLTCEQYAISLKLSTVRGDAGAVQYHRRYISQSTERTKGGNGANSSEDDPKLLEVIGPAVSAATLTPKPFNDQSRFGKEHATVPSNLQNQTTMRRSFYLKAEDTHMILGYHKKKANHGSNILSFFKKSRRHL